MSRAALLPTQYQTQESILSQFPDLSAHREGHDVLLAFDKDLGLALCRACNQDYDDEAICLATVAKIVWRDMFKLQAIFTGSFDEDCQINSQPKSLLALVAMISGPNIKSQGTDGLSQAIISISQLLQYNSFVRQRAGSTGAHHIKVRETPLPIYVGLTIHARTRRHGLVENMFALGLSISYGSVMEISAELGNHVCEQQYLRDQVVCPPQGLFTSSAIDNMTTILAQQLPQMLCTVLDCHFSSIPVIKIMGMTTGNIISWKRDPQPRHC